MSDTPDQTVRDDAPAQDQPEAAAKKSKLSPVTKLVLLAVVVVLVVLGIVWFIHHQTVGKYLQSTDDATIAADAVVIAPKVSGYVEQVLVIDNQDVKAGDPLVRIDPRDYRARAEQAQAQIAQAAASTENARAGIAEQYAAIDQVRAQLAAARTKAAHDAAEVARYTPLAASGAETRQQLAQLQLAAKQSAEDARAQAAALVAQERRIASIRAQVRQGEAQAQGARAQLAAANVDVGATILRASINGRIGDKTVTLGQFAQAGTRLMSLVPLDKIYVTANFKETQLALMRAGQPATIEVDALGGTELHGRVESVSPGTGGEFSLLPPQNATGNFTKIVQRVPVRIAIDATPAARKLLVPGLSVTVTVNTIGAKGELDHIRDQEKQREKARTRG
ncbi:HlyD family secretion protein [Sphingomonas sp. H39-1-10]|uniref:HlyD family secretion protein n=1 Tax=Sphingomonas pollutisoli TaxID=3030829 RepID=UPI0023B96B35|nr:HlyD family secretion protein [Sphingomonas pollutisoli]MDF0487560.1 HlyD family secretion protein [Sphingomonas pollutisoli]